MENKITDGPIPKQLMSFFLPIMFGILFQQLYSTVDAIIVGKYIGTQALAAVGNTSVFISLLVGFFFGISSGAGVVISQFFGGKKDREVSHAVHTSYSLAFWGSILFMIIGLLISPFMLRAMGTPEDIYQLSLEYTRIYFVGIVPMMIYNIGTGVLRAIGDSKRPLYILIVASLINIVLDLVFVIVLDLGVAGTAVATDLAQMVSAILVTLCLMKSKGKSYQLFIKKIHVQRDLLYQIVRIGIPVGLQSVMYSVSNMIIQYYINMFGTSSVAAWTAYGKVDFLFWMLVNSMGIAATTFAGQNYGANKIKRVKDGNRVALVISAVITLSLTVIFLLIPKELLLIFTSDQEVIQIGVLMIRYLAPCYITYISIEILSGTIRGCGTVVIPTLITGVGVCGTRILWLFTMMKVMPSMNIVMASYPISWALSSLLFWIYYERGHWMDGKRLVERLH